MSSPATRSPGCGHLGNARGHFHIGAEDEYDLHVDVASISSYDVAVEIVTALRS